jgi:hypothetical protein
MVRATRLTVPVSLASDLVPFIDCVQTTSAPNRLPVTVLLQPAGEWCIERAACGVGEPLHAVCGACWCYPEICLSS